MSDFLLIIPEGWYEFDDINALINDGVFPADEVYLWVTAAEWTAFDSMLINANHPVDGKTVIGAKLFQAETGFRCWFRLV